MLDYYSEIPAPSVSSEQKKIKHRYKEKNIIKDIYVSEEEQDDILEKIFKPHVNDSGNIIYSYTGWYATGLSREMESEFNKHMKKLKQKKRINRKLKIVFRIVYILIKWHNQSKERLYHPNNPYVKNILSQRFNLFI